MITGSETTHLLARPPQLFLEARMPAIDVQDILQLGLRDGQVVRPTIEVEGQGVRLLLQGRQFEAPSAWRPLAGQAVALQVQLMPDGSARLRPLSQAPAQPLSAAGSAPSAAQSTQTSASQPLVPALPADPAQPVSIGIARLVMRSPELSAWLDVLRTLAAQPATGAAAASPDALSSLMSLLPRMASLSGQSLRAGIQRSGLLTEALLARGDAESALPDLKSVLRALRAHPDGVGDAFDARIDEAIDDIESAQVQCSDALQPRLMLLNAALGFADAPPVRLQITREGGPDAPPEIPWVVQVSSESPRWGALWLQTRVFTDGRVALTMWADRPEVANLARQAVGSLSTELAQSGLRLSAFQAIDGPVPAAHPPNDASAGRVLDLRA